MVGIVHKVFLAGEGNTGKTEIFKRFTGYSFGPGPTRAFNLAQRNIEDLDLSIQLIDLSGKKVYADFREAIFRNVIAGILVFDLSDKVTMFLLQDWLRDIQSAQSKVNSFDNQPLLFVVGNKMDLREEGKSCLSTEEVQTFIERLKAKFKCDMKYLEVSAKNHIGITELIRKIAEEIKLSTTSEKTEGDDKEEETTSPESTDRTGSNE
ncbi:MAG: ADP-ribosylation factor-like protein [Candidatus Odinarchaeota archaeon]